jgi:Mycotoxin biosynthesis protein UstYa
MITPAELGKIDMPASSLKVKHPKTGVEGYRVGLEVFHQLHCVNLLRQVTYKDYYTELGNGNFAGGQEELQVHTGIYFLITIRDAAS